MSLHDSFLHVFHDERCIGQINSKALLFSDSLTTKLVIRGKAGGMSTFRYFLRWRFFSQCVDALAIGIEIIHEMHDESECRRE